MSLVQKDTQIILCKNIPFDNKYTDVILFPSEATRIAYFTSKSVGNFSALSYQKTNTNVFKLEVPYAKVFDVSYCLFKNPDFGGRWFYAFINSVEYINNVTTLFTYEIDVMQTYFRNANLEQCFVEREHTSDDSVGSNIVKENIAMGDYIRDLSPATQDLGESNTFIQVGANAIYSTFESELRGKMKGNLYDGLSYISPPENTVESIYETIRALSLGEGVGLINVISVLRSPFPRVNNGLNNGVLKYGKFVTGSLDGYTPKNNKLYTYPYNFIRFWGTNGAEIQIRPEFVDGNEVEISYSGVISPNSPFRFSIRNYAITKQPIIINMGCSSNYLSDTTFIKLGIQLGATALAVATQGASVPITSTITEKFTGTEKNFVGRKIDTKHTEQYETEKTVTNEGGKSNLPFDVTNYIGALNSFNPITASLEGESFGSSLGTANAIYFEHCCQPRQILRQIDDFFTRYGYATMRLKKPSLTSRRYFNYVKTQGCDTRVLAPAVDKAKISTIFDSGVTFWHLPNNTDDSVVGNYSLDNSIV